MWSPSRFPLFTQLKSTLIYPPVEHNKILRTHRLPLLQVCYWSRQREPSARGMLSTTVSRMCRTSWCEPAPLGLHWQGWWAGKQRKFIFYNAKIEITKADHICNVTAELKSNPAHSSLKQWKNKILKETFIIEKTKNVMKDKAELYFQENTLLFWDPVIFNNPHNRSNWTQSFIK